MVQGDLAGFLARNASQSFFLNPSWDFLVFQDEAASGINRWWDSVSHSQSRIFDSIIWNNIAASHILGQWSTYNKMINPFLLPRPRGGYKQKRCGGAECCTIGTICWKFHHDSWNDWKYSSSRRRGVHLFLVCRHERLWRLPPRFVRNRCRPNSRNICREQRWCGNENGERIRINWQGVRSEHCFATGSRIFSPQTESSMESFCSKTRTRLGWLLKFFKPITILCSDQYISSFKL